MADDSDMLMWGVLLMGQCVQAESSDDEEEDNNRPPLYRAPIAYEKKEWSLAESGWGDTECLEYLRFSRAEILELIEWVESPVKTLGRYAKCAEQALCMLLYRLSSPGRLKDMMHVFGISRSQISSIVIDLAIFLHQKYHKKLFWDHQRLSMAQLRSYVKAIDGTAKESMQTWGFIDGTVRPIARPTIEQQRYYSGHKGYHGIKFQSIVTPDGLISSLYGPRFSPTGDWKLWKESRVEQILRQIFKPNAPIAPNEANTPNEVLYLYGDPAYAPSYGVRAPYRAGRYGLTPNQEAFNVMMSKYRIVVEWGFANVLNQFTSGEWKRVQKVGLSPVAVNYMLSVFLWNCQTCLA